MSEKKRQLGLPFSEILRMAWSSVCTHKLRSALTMLGIAIGVFSVIGAMTVISALQASIEEQLNVLGSTSFQISKYPAIHSHGPINPYANRRNIMIGQAQRVKELLADTGATISLNVGRYGRQVFYEDKKTNPNNNLVGTDEAFITGRSYNVAIGRNLTPQDVEYGRAVCVIGADTRDRLIPVGDPIGAIIRVDGQGYRVVGVLERKGELFGQSQDNIVLISITRFLQVYGRENRSIGINVQARTQAEMGEVMDRAFGAMRVVRGLQPEDANDFEIFSNDTLVNAFDKIAKVVGAGAFVISLIALLAAGVGIMNIMLVSVTERTKEIGIRKSLGAQRRAILRQFLIEAMVIAQCGGLIGIAMGVGGGNLVAKAMNAGAVFPVGWTITGFVFCSAIGVGFGFYPAWKAARLDPIEALRFE
jgi:putative ABC transport system permease protein